MEWTLILNLDYVIQSVVFPTGKIHGTCELDEEGRAIVLLSGIDCPDRQLDALKHELLHYIFSDHYRSREIAEAETRKAEHLYDIEIGPNAEYIRIWKMSEEELRKKYGWRRYRAEFAGLGA